ncbi:MAG: hypothetical protein GY784_15245 [Gammaproteobacteria bacterium]|nr:hypothetical protein [Gammaproteobacteria bacterium]
MPNPVKTLFFGTGAFFSLKVLGSLIELGHRPIGVVVPEYAGVNTPVTDGLLFEQKGRDNPLIKLAVANEIEVIFAPSGCHDELSHKAFEYILVACWPGLISPDVYGLAGTAAFNLHPSLLPEYRGANPLEEQIRLGELRLGVTLHELDQGMDTGPIVRQSGFELAQDAYCRENIENRAAKLGAELFVQVIGN